MLRKGFTLIELLIVITIIAILAGAAIPYVADYIEDGRAARAKQDMSEIRNALVRWELDRGTWNNADVSIEKLVGPYLSQLLIDPWGFPYVITGADSTITSYGKDGATGGGDDLILDFRPPMAVTKVEYSDVDRSGTQSQGDILTFYFTRPGALGASTLADITIGATTLDNLVDVPGADITFAGRTAVCVVDSANDGGFVWAGNDITIAAAPTNAFFDTAAVPNAVKEVTVGTLKLKATGW